MVHKTAEKELTVIGRIREIMGDDSYPSITDLISEHEHKHKNEILNHLKKGVVTAAAPAILNDVITGERLNMPLTMMNDGKYEWRSDLIYYFEKYNIELPEAFIDYVLKDFKGYLYVRKENS